MLSLCLYFSLALKDEQNKRKKRHRETDKQTDREKVKETERFWLSYYLFPELMKYFKCSSGWLSWCVYNFVFFFFFSESFI